MNSSEAIDDLDELYKRLEKTKDIIYSKLNVSGDFCVFKYFPGIIEHGKKNITNYDSKKGNLDDLNKIFYFTELISHQNFSRDHAQKVVKFIKEKIPCHSSCINFDNFSSFDSLIEYTESITKKQNALLIGFDIKKILSSLNIY